MLYSTSKNLDHLFGNVLYGCTSLRCSVFLLPPFRSRTIKDLSLHSHFCKKGIFFFFFWRQARVLFWRVFMAREFKGLGEVFG